MEERLIENMRLLLSERPTNQQTYFSPPFPGSATRKTMACPLPIGPCCFYQMYPTQSPAYADVRRYDLRSRAWPFLLHSSAVAAAEGGWRVRSSLSAPAAAGAGGGGHAGEQQSCQTKSICSANPQQRNAAQMSTVHDR